MFEDEIIQLIKEKNQAEVITLLKTRLSQPIFPDLEALYPDSKNRVATKKPVYLWAAEYGLINVMQELEKQGANFKSQCSAGRNVLYYVCESNNAEALKHVLDTMRSNLSNDEFNGWINNQNYDVFSKATLLYHAARRNRVKIVKLLKQAGANLNTKNDVGFAPIHAAVLYGCLETVHELLTELDQRENQLKLFATSYGYKGYTAFHIAVIIKEEKSNEIKKKQTKDINHKDPIKMIQAFLKLDKTLIHQKTYEGETPLRLAIKYGALESVKCLINAGIKPDEAELKIAKKAFNCGDDDSNKILDLIKHALSQREILEVKDEQQLFIVPNADASTSALLQLPEISLDTVINLQQQNNLLTANNYQTSIVNTNTFFYHKNLNYTNQLIPSQVQQHNNNVYMLQKRKNEGDEIDVCLTKKAKIDASEQKNTVDRQKVEFAKILNN